MRGGMIENVQYLDVARLFRLFIRLTKQICTRLGRLVLGELIRAHRLMRRTGFRGRYNVLTHRIQTSCRWAQSPWLPPQSLTPAPVHDAKTRIPGLARQVCEDSTTDDVHDPAPGSGPSESKWRFARRNMFVGDRWRRTT